MKFLSLLLILTSCTISYYYKGKDLHKAHNKSNKQVDKVIRQFDKVDEFKRVFAQMETSKLPTGVKNELRGGIKRCTDFRTQIKTEQNKRNAYFRQLNIRKNKKYVKKDNNYSQVKAFADSFDSYGDKLKSLVDQAESTCKKPNEIITKYDIKILSADSLYRKFDQHKKELEKSVRQVRKKKASFTEKVKKSKHKNKGKILTKIKEIGGLLREINGQVVVLDKEVSSLKKQYGSIKQLVVAKGTKAYAATKKLEGNIGKYNQILKRFENTTKEINRLGRE